MLHVCKKQIHHKGILIKSTKFNHIWWKYQSIMHNISSSEKIQPLLYSHIKINQNICLKLFWTVVNVAYFSWLYDFFTGKGNIMDRGLHF